MKTATSNNLNMKMALQSSNHFLSKVLTIVSVKVIKFQNINHNQIQSTSGIQYTWIFKFWALIFDIIYLYSRELKNGKLVTPILKFLSILGWVWGGCGGANIGTINPRWLCQNFIWKWPKFPSVKIIFKLHFDITKVQLFMHHNYFEWAPCIETFGFFSKCELSRNN